MREGEAYFDMHAVHLADEAETERTGRLLAAHLRPGDVVCLTGDLGAGKTTLARAIIRALFGPQTEVPSPTYTLVQEYESDTHILWHLDLYRLETPEDVEQLGWRDMEDGIRLVEWPDKAGRFMPEDRLILELVTTGDTSRELRFILPSEAWHDRVRDVLDVWSPREAETE